MLLFSVISWQTFISAWFCPIKKIFSIWASHWLLSYNFQQLYVICFCILELKCSVMFWCSFINCLKKLMLLWSLIDLIYYFSHTMHASSSSTLHFYLVPLDYLYYVCYEWIEHAFAVSTLIYYTCLYLAYNCNIYVYTCVTLKYSFIHP